MPWEVDILLVVRISKEEDLTTLDAKSFDMKLESEKGSHKESFVSKEADAVRKRLTMATLAPEEFRKNAGPNEEFLIAGATLLGVGVLGAAGGAAAAALLAEQVPADSSLSKEERQTAADGVQGAFIFAVISGAIAVCGGVLLGTAYLEE